ncbi:MAG TPA: ribonuclease HII [Chloroflexi bacterium]|nr:ribonuclease HII [Chloroflexota bacterium]
MIIPTLQFETELRRAGHRHIVGLDEVGRGCWAGPVVAGAVILPVDDRAACLVLRAAGARDSKLLSPAQRETLVPLIKEVALAVAVGGASAAEIDELGIAPASRLAMRRALAGLDLKGDALLLDAFPLREISLPQRAIVRGDQHSLSIAAASIIAKVYRDRLMCAYESDFPGYDFARNKGYGTPAHRAALAAFGPTRLHRLTWAPLLARQLALDLREATDEGKA